MCNAQPGAGGKDFVVTLKVVTAYVEPSLANSKPDDKYQFEPHGSFVADREDHAAGKPMFNLAVGVKRQLGK